MLFERTNGGTRRTVAGLEFFELACRILEDTETALRNLKSRGQGETGRLTIGVYASMATGNMQATLADYRRRFPDVDAHMSCPLSGALPPRRHVAGESQSDPDRTLERQPVAKMPSRTP
jgi:DNA-binding transcriptional LysR family regulator